MKSRPRLGTLTVGKNRYRYLDITSFGIETVSRLPYSLRILLEHLGRYCDGQTVTDRHIRAVLERGLPPGERAQVGVEADSAAAAEGGSDPLEIPFFPGRVLMQDYTGVPAVVDLCALREAAAAAGCDPELVNPRIPVDLVIDHSVQIDRQGTRDALEFNTALEYARNDERYRLLAWAKEHFTSFRVVPPKSGICHQVNLEYLAACAAVLAPSAALSPAVRELYPGEAENQLPVIVPDSLLGTDSHTTMINGLGILGWGVGGIEAEAVMLGQPYMMPVPRVCGVRLKGRLSPVCTAADLVLTVTELLRAIGVVGWFVEFFGPGLSELSLPDRATVANMCPEYGATAAYMPIDERTIDYLASTGRPEAAERTRIYSRINCLYHEIGTEAVYDRVVELSLGSVEPCIAGPFRPQDRIPLRLAKSALPSILSRDNAFGLTENGYGQTWQSAVRTPTLAAGTEAPGAHHQVRHLGDGALVIAAITSCTSTSNPSALIAAGLLAGKASERGLRPPSWVKTSLAPGSRVVVDYLASAGLLDPLEELGFSVAAFGCTTCIGNSGPLLPEAEDARRHTDPLLCAALSGNRNFEGRIHPAVKAAFLMSPPLVVAYALAGTMFIDPLSEPLGFDREDRPVFLEEIWPSRAEIDAVVSVHLRSEDFRREYAGIFTGDERWNRLSAPEGAIFGWNAESSYIARPPFLDEISGCPPHGSVRANVIAGARALLVLGDSVTTDHISPAGAIDPESPAGRYLRSIGIAPPDFNSYGARRGNHEVMVRGTFSNARIRQLLTPGISGGFTRKLPEGSVTTVYDAACAYRREAVPLIILAGKEYGTGSSRDWAAKGTALLGVAAVIAESFERIHRSNLVGMGVLPLTFVDGQSVAMLGLVGTERFTINLPEEITPGQLLRIRAEADTGESIRFTVRCRLDSPTEIAWYRLGGILPFVLQNMMIDKGLETIG